MPKRRPRAKKAARPPSDDRDAKFRAYVARVIDCLAHQVVETGGVCPPFVTIPEPADEQQSEYICILIRKWALERFGVPTIKVRIEDDDTSAVCNDD